MNKYSQVPGDIIDLHGYTTLEAKDILDTLIREEKHHHIRIITGKGLHSADGPVLKDFVKRYLDAHDKRYNQSKLHDGGEGALEVFLL